MNIALLGYGKMGKTIEQLALDKGHQIALRVDDKQSFDLSAVDVAIDFSTPEAAVSNISQCLKNNTPVVSGTTGWLDRYEEMVNLCHQQQGAFLYASNFSVGVNLFFALNEKLAQLMKGQQQYRPSMEEIHHTQKLDAPSGTAITLAEGIIKEHIRKAWVNLTPEQDITKTDQDQLPIVSKRLGDVPGTHTISFQSDIDEITITHKAHSRAGFAAGALQAAEWLVGKQGVYSMQDVLNLS
ncbi:4-hydroxy-tetrahydrodipicolinate reductase [Croceiramulus getboli]|nr:4-hydroxy-tetrahydrodipicolinate reductase [Flavobacteriaceae bacterium YJPT1-3]